MNRLLESQIGHDNVELGTGSGSFINLISHKKKLYNNFFETIISINIDFIKYKLFNQKELFIKKKLKMNLSMR